MTYAWAEIFIATMFFVAGVISVCASVFNWHWFFIFFYARLLTGRYSRRTARAIYGIVGCLILAMDYVIVCELLSGHSN